MLVLKIMKKTCEITSGAIYRTLDHFCHMQLYSFRKDKIISGKIKFNSILLFLWYDNLWVNNHHNTSMK